MATPTASSQESKTASPGERKIYRACGGIKVDPSQETHYARLSEVTGLDIETVRDHFRTKEGIEEIYAMYHAAKGE